MSIYYSTYGNGLLYNWYAVEGRDSNNVLHRFAPVGWHVPTRTEFETLATYLGGASVAGGKMKSTRTGLQPGWDSPNTLADDSSGFRAFGAGVRLDSDGLFYLISSSLYLSTSTVSGSNMYGLRIYYNNATVNNSIVYSKKRGMSVRLLKDDSNWYPGMVVTDLDGNLYATVKIGDQVWLQSNWKCTKYADGVPIASSLVAFPGVKFSNTEWQNLTYGGYCSYNDVAIVEYTTPNQYKYPTKHFILPKVTDLSAQKNNGLVAAYNMQPVNGVLTDISGNGGNMTVTSCVNSNEGLVFKGLPSYTQCSSGTIGDISTGDFTLCARVKPHSLTGTSMHIISKGGAGSIGYALYISSSGVVSVAIQATGGTNQAITIGYTVVLNKWINIVVTFDRDDVVKCYINGIYINQGTYSSGNTNSLSNASNLTIGKFKSSTSFPYYGEIADVRIYNKVLSTKEIKDYHNSFVKPTLIEDFKNNPINTNLTPYGWNKGTGVYKVSKLSADVTSGTLKLPKNTHYLECVTAGTLAIPSSQAYGTWEFSWYKGNTNNDTIISIISSSNTSYLKSSGYVIWINSTEKIYLDKINNGASALNYTADNSILNNTWYKMKVTRTTAGVFTLFIKGGAFIPTEGYNGWTLVSTSGGSGTNPLTDTTYSSSNYFVLDLDASDRIADIKLTDGIIV